MRFAFFWKTPPLHWLYLQIFTALQLLHTSCPPPYVKSGGVSTANISASSNIGQLDTDWLVTGLPKRNVRYHKEFSTGGVCKLPGPKWLCTGKYLNTYQMFFKSRSKTDYDFLLKPYPRPIDPCPNLLPHIPSIQVTVLWKHRRKLLMRWPVSVKQGMGMGGWRRSYCEKLSS